MGAAHQHNLLGGRFAGAYGHQVHDVDAVDRVLLVPVTLPLTGRLLAAGVRAPGRASLLRASRRLRDSSASTRACSKNRSSSSNSSTVLDGDAGLRPQGTSRPGRRNTTAGPGEPDRLGLAPRLTPRVTRADHATPTCAESSVRGPCAGPAPPVDPTERGAGDTNGVAQLDATLPLPGRHQRSVLRTLGDLRVSRKAQRVHHVHDGLPRASLPELGRRLTQRPGQTDAGHP